MLKHVFIYSTEASPRGVTSPGRLVSTTTLFSAFGFVFYVPLCRVEPTLQLSLCTESWNPQIFKQSCNADFVVWFREICLRKKGTPLFFRWKKRHWLQNTLNPPSLSLSLFKADNTHCSPIICHSWLVKKSPISLSALPFYFLFLLFARLLLLTVPFSTMFFSLLFLPSSIFSILVSPLPRPLFIPVCYPSSPCRQRSLTTDSLLPFLLPNPYTTSRYWLHAELRGPQPPPLPPGFPCCLSRHVSLSVKRHQCDCSLGCGSVIDLHFLLCTISGVAH